MDHQSSPAIRYISECYIKPENMPLKSNQPYNLAPWDLAMMTVQYIQKGLLFAKPREAYQQQDYTYILTQKLKHSLSKTLTYFYPLAGRLQTIKTEDPECYSISVDCKNSPGAKFIYADINMTISDILSPIYVPSVVQLFFDHDRAINHDGHTRSLLSVQVTELVDGIFIGVSINHSLVDGTSYWHFLNSWSEVFKAGGENVMISRPPVLERWVADGGDPVIDLPFARSQDFISRFESPVLKERFFGFSSESIRMLKEKANSEGNTDKISSFQALSALVWRCITRARRLPYDQITSCRMAAGNRARMEPPLSPNYFGNSISVVKGVATSGELLEHNLGWAAWKLHDAVTNHSTEAINLSLNDWLGSPYVYQIARLFDPMSVMMGSSPRFDKYGPEFGMGKALALRSGYAHKFDGKASAYPGRKGGGSIDLEVCLLPEHMSAIESDEEFLFAASL